MWEITNKYLTSQQKYGCEFQLIINPLIITNVICGYILISYILP